MATSFVSQAKHKYCAIFAIFTPYESVLGVDDRSAILFNISSDVVMATNFVSYRTFSLGAEVSQDPLDRFSQSLHHMVGIELQMINATLFFSDILRDIAMATNLVAIMGQNYLLPALIALLFRKIMGFRYLIVCINSINNASVSCEICLKFGPVNS